MQLLEVSGAVRPIYGSLGVKRLIKTRQTILQVITWEQTHGQADRYDDTPSLHSLIQEEEWASTEHAK